MLLGGADDFLDRLCVVAQAPAVLVGAQPPERSLDPPLAIVLQVGVELRHELASAHARPVPEVEELVLQPADEALTGGVVRAAALRGHAPEQPVLLA